MFENCGACAYRYWEQDTEERALGSEGKVLNFKFELKILNSILNNFQLLNNPIWVEIVREAVGYSRPVLHA